MNEKIYTSVIFDNTMINMILDNLKEFKLYSQKDKLIFKKIMRNPNILYEFEDEYTKSHLLNLMRLQTESQIRRYIKRVKGNQRRILLCICHILDRIFFQNNLSINCKYRLMNNCNHEKNNGIQCDLTVCPFREELVSNVDHKQGKLIELPKELQLESANNLKLEINQIKVKNK